VVFYFYLRMDFKIPYFSLEYQNRLIRNEALQAMEEVWEAQWYILGEQLQAFEKDYAAFTGTAHCCGVGNGFDALYIALKVLGLGPGDEVIVPAHTFIATWLAVSHTGAMPVPIEPRYDTCNLDPGKIEAAITARTKAILPVHLYGQACEMGAIMAIAQKYRLYVVEDNAQAQGAGYKNQLTGSFGHLNATSFYPTKNIGAFGDGGAITTQQKDLARQVRAFRNYGSEVKYQHDQLGVNSRLDEIQAALLRVKLPYLQKWTTERQHLARLYHAGLPDLPELLLPVTAPGATHVYHIYQVRTPHRDKLQAYLSQRGIETQIHYPVPPHLQKAYESRGLVASTFPVAEEIARTSLSLPLWPGLKEDQIEYVCACIRDFFRK